MSNDIPTAPTPDPVAPKASSVDWAQITKYALAVALGSSVLVLVILGKTPVNTYLQYVVGPGLVALGWHAAGISKQP